MAGSGKSGVYAFDNFALDVDKLMLYRDGEEILIAAKVAKTLAVLVERSGTIIPKEELIDLVWDDAIVEESNLTQYLYLLRKTLGSMPDDRPYIETFRRRGYRFNGEVREVEAQAPGLQPLGSESVVNFGGVERDGNVLRVVDWKPQTSDLETGVVELTRSPVESRFWPRLVIAVFAIVIIGVGSIIFFWPRLMPMATGAESKRERDVVRLTNGGFPMGATISPDGNYFVYHEADGDTFRLFLQQTGQASRLELAASSDKVYHAKTFSPDGQFIYCVAYDKSARSTNLYRIPTLGGALTKVLNDVNGIVSFSPDGKELVFRRMSGSTSMLIIADNDGRSERVLLQRQATKVLAPAAAWSPAGDDIIFAEQDFYDGSKIPRYLFFTVKVATGQVAQLSKEKWDNVLEAIWMPDGKGFVAVATRENDAYSTRRDQIYYISYPGGISQRITTEGNRHEPESLGVTKNGSILAVPANRSSQIWSMNANGDASSAIQLTRGLADGRSGLGLLPDGRIAFVARTADEIGIFVAGSAAGTEARQLATGFPFLEELRTDPGGKFLIFSTVKGENHHLFRMDIETGEVKQVTQGEGNEIDSTISPDSTTIVAETAILGSNVAQSYLMKIPSSGGAAVKLATASCETPTYSPDGSLISCVRISKPEIVIATASDGAELERYPLPTFATSNFGIGWTRDGSGLIYIGSEKGVSNLWVQARDGSKPRPLTNFSSGVIHRYAFSPDGERLLVARGYPIQDVVLISNFR